MYSWKTKHVHPNLNNRKVCMFGKQKHANVSSYNTKKESMCEHVYQASIFKIEDMIKSLFVQFSRTSLLPPNFLDFKKKISL